MSKGENALVEWLQERLAADRKRVPIGIGDDAAAVQLTGTLVVVTADMLLDGVHFETSKHSYELIGRKAIACSLSDCAATACQPRVATVSIALNKAMSMDEVKQLYEGMAGIASEFDCPIVGGDTTDWSGGLAIDVAMLAEPMSSRGPVRRSDARIGDAIYVSGPLGGSLAGKHLTFTPRIELASLLVHEPDLHAMMDLSDGLAMDLLRMCTVSGCDAELFAEQLEKAISDAARNCSQADGRSPLEHALSDGEDFELLVAGGRKLDHEKFGLIRIGQMVRRSAADRSMIVIVSQAGQREPIKPCGYEHFI